MKPTDFSKTLTKYFTVHLAGTRNLSPNTIGSYSDTFRLFLTYCQEKRSIRPEKLSFRNFSDSMVIEFLDWLQEERGCGIPKKEALQSTIWGVSPCFH